LAVEKSNARENSELRLGALNCISHDYYLFSLYFHRGGETSLLQILQGKRDSNPQPAALETATLAN
jgi:hypothetical protein